MTRTSTWAITIATWVVMDLLFAAVGLQTVREGLTTDLQMAWYGGMMLLANWAGCRAGRAGE